MGIFNFITENFTRKKALEDSGQRFDIKQRVADKSYGGISLPIVPQSQEEAARLTREGYVPYQNPSARSHSPTAYVTPERIIMEAEREDLDFERNLAHENYQNKISNPFFNIGDTALDILNNTVGLPFKAVGQPLFNNPSAKAEKGYIQKLEDISSLHGTNIEHYLEKRRERDDAFLTGMSNVGVNDITPGHYTNASIAKFQQSGDFNDLEFKKHTTYKGVDGVEYIETEKGMVPLISMKTQMENEADLIKARAFAEAQAKFNNNKSSLEASLKGARQKHNALKLNISNAIKLVKTARGAGWNGIFRNLPATVAKDLDAKLKTIKANVAFESLREMRANSPTGGALGNVSDREIELLYNSLMPLDQLSTDEMLIQSLEFIEQANTETLKNMNNKYQQDVGRYGFDQKEVKILSKDQQDTQAGQNQIPTQTPNLDEVINNDPKVKAAVDLIERLKANQEVR